MWWNHAGGGKTVYHTVCAEQICAGTGGTASGETVSSCGKDICADGGRRVLHKERVGD